MKRTTIIVAIILSLSLLAGGCASSGGNSATAPMPAPAAPAASAALQGTSAGIYGGAGAAGESAAAYDMAREMSSVEKAVMEDSESGIIPPIGGVGSPAVNADAANRKIIYTADLRMQTKEFDVGISQVERMTAEYGGFIQRTSVEGKNLRDYGGQSGRYASYTVRIPESGMRNYLSDLEQYFNISSSNMYSDDITGTYFDTQARLESLKVQQKKLLEMLDKAEDVTYLLEVQKELARVGYEVEALTSSMNRMDDSVSFSTVNLYIEEVIEYTATQSIATPFSVQISNAFSGSWRNFDYFCRSLVLALVSLTPLLTVLIPLAAVVIALIRIRAKRRRSRAVSAVSIKAEDTEQPPSPEDK